MKIALVVPGFSADENDWCIPVLLDFVRVLSREHEVHVFTLRYPHRQAIYKVYGATVHAFNGQQRTGLYRFKLIGQAWRAIRTEHRRAPFDVVHGLWAEEPGLIAIWAAKRWKLPSIVSLMGGECANLPTIGYGYQRSRFMRWLVGYSAHRADILTAGSVWLATQAQTLFQREEVRVMPLGVDTQFFQPAIHPQKLAGNFRILNVASLNAVKDQALLVDALAILRQHVAGVHLHVVGEGAMRKSLEAQIERLNLAPNVTLHGDIPHEALPAFYTGADVHAMTSLYESQNMATLEAAACACLPIGTRVGILPALLPVELTVAVGDAEKLAQVLLAIFEQRDHYQALTQAIYQQCVADYSLAVTMARWVELYRGLI